MEKTWPKGGTDNNKTHTAHTKEKGLRFLKGLKILQHTRIRTNENHTHGHKPKSIKSDREREGEESL